MEQESPQEDGRGDLGDRLANALVWLGVAAVLVGAGLIVWGAVR